MPISLRWAEQGETESTRGNETNVQQIVRSYVCDRHWSRISVLLSHPPVRRRLHQQARELYVLQAWSLASRALRYQDHAASCQGMQSKNQILSYYLWILLKELNRNQPILSGGFKPFQILRIGFNPCKTRRRSMKNRLRKKLLGFPSGRGHNKKVC